MGKHDKKYSPSEKADFIASIASIIASVVTVIIAILQFLKD